MWDPETNRLHASRDVVWIRRMHYGKQERPLDYMNQPDLQISLFRDKEESVLDLASMSVAEDSNQAHVAGTEDGSDDDEGAENDDATSLVQEQERNGVRIRSGRNIRPPARFFNEENEIGEVHFSAMENRYYASLQAAIALEMDVDEIACVEAGIGGGFENTNELHVLKFKKAMATESKDKWKTAVEEEHERMVKHNVWKPVLRSSISPKTTPLTSTWAMHKNASGNYRARLNARGFQQIPGKHYDSKSISSPVTNDVSIRIMLTLMLIGKWHAEIVDVKGAFLHGEFHDGEEIHMEVPEGFERHYSDNVVLMLQRTLYGLEQCARAFGENC